jgi:hypothetical protein
MKKSILLTYFLITSLAAFSQDQSSNIVTIGKGGIGLGAAIAVAISWDKNKSIKWAILHGIVSWFYVIYHYFTRK